MDKKLEKGIKEIKEIKMTSSEKKSMLLHILNTPTKKVSPYNSIIFYLRHSKLVYYIIVPLFVIIAGTGTVFASLESLPDSPLYELKVSVVEPIKSALILNPKSKAEYQSELATKRLIEAETLADNGKLNKTQEKKISKLLDEHTNSFNSNLQKISNGTKDDIATSFNAQMNAHAKVLGIIENSEDKSNISKIEETARDNALKVKNDIKNKGDFKEYSKRKEKVQSIIDKTSKDLNNVPDNVSLPNRKMINDTLEKLDQAGKLLNQADSQSESDQSGAYKTLIDSESSAKEANVLLQTGLKWKEKMHGEKGNGGE